jgi:CubicO group peptidase (beta-lactamase class C family)
MTLQDLVTHHSGLPDDPASYPPLRFTYTLHELYSDLDDAALVGCPGDRYAYSNFGFGLLGQLILSVEGIPVGSSAISQGQAFGQLVAGVITGPLGMRATGLEPLGADPQIAVPYASSASTPVQRWDDVGALTADGGLVSTVPNLERLLKAALGEGPRGLVRWLAATERPLAPGAAPGYRMGMAWQLETGNWYPRTYLVKDGLSDGMSSYVAIVRSKHIGVVVLADQGASVPDYLGELILHAITPGSRAPAPPQPTPAVRAASRSRATPARPKAAASGPKAAPAQTNGFSTRTPS